MLDHAIRARAAPDGARRRGAADRTIASAQVATDAAAPALQHTAEVEAAVPTLSGVARGGSPIRDALQRTLARAVALRGASALPRLRAPTLQRLFFDPGDVTNSASARLQAATYVWTNGKRIATEYLEEEFGPAPSDPDIESLLRRTFAEVAIAAGAGNDIENSGRRLARDLANGMTLYQARLLAPGAPVEKTKVLEIAVRTLNTLEQDTATRHATVRSLTRDVKVGTEFTFTNADIRKIKPGTNDGAAKKKIADWRALVEADKALKPTRIEAVKGKADSGETQKSAVKFHYRVRSNTGNDFDWFWVLDMDPGCLETQTKPATSDQLVETKAIMRRHIFDLATGAKLNLVVDETAMGGGGHISLDMASLFGGSPELLLGVLNALQDDVAAWDEHFRYVDEPNSPWLKDQGFEANTTKGKALQEFKLLVGQLEREIQTGAVTFDAMTIRLRDFHTKVLNLWAHARKDSKNLAEKKQAGEILITKDRPHYQAVNIEHLVKPSEAKDEERRRIELRAIGAQASTDRLAQDLTFIYGRIERAQTAVLERVAERKRRRTS